MGCRADEPAASRHRPTLRTQTADSVELASVASPGADVPPSAAAPVMHDALLSSAIENEPADGLASPAELSAVVADEGPPVAGTPESRRTLDHSLLLDGVDGDEDERRSDSQSMRLRRTPVWGASMNTIAFMCVPRTVPACFAATGWTVGVVSLLYSSIVTYDTGLLLGVVCNELHSSAACSFPSLAAEAASRCAARYGRDPRAQQLWRKAGAIVVGTLQHTCYYLTGVAELIYFEQFMGQLFDTSPLCQWQWLLIVGLLCLPVLQIPSFHATRFAALILGVLPLLLNVVVFFYEILIVQRPWDCEPGPTYAQWPRSPGKAAVGLTAFAYAFGGHGLYPEQIREMSQPQRWPRVMSVTYGFTLPLYWACGLLGYYAFGEYSKANINLNFPNNTANRISSRRCPTYRLHPALALASIAPGPSTLTPSALDSRENEQSPFRRSKSSSSCLIRTSS